MLEARLWMKKSDKNYLGKGRIELLERIRHHGSIHAAAKAMRMSYKAAWDAVDAMNNLSEVPLVQKISGGKGGGGTLLTAKGEEVIEAFHALEQKHQQFLNLFADSDDLSSIVQTLNRLSLKLSARNQVMGKVTGIEAGEINVKIEMTIKEIEKLYATITHSSYAELGIHKGDTIVAIIKANSVFFSKTAPKADYENILRGKIVQIVNDASSTEITLELPSQSTITTAVPNDILQSYDPKVGDDAYVFFKASSVILGI